MALFCDRCLSFKNLEESGMIKSRQLNIQNKASNWNQCSYRNLWVTDAVKFLLTKQDESSCIHKSIPYSRIMALNICGTLIFPADVYIPAIHKHYTANVRIIIMRLYREQLHWNHLFIGNLGTTKWRFQSLSLILHCPTL